MHSNSDTQAEEEDTVPRQRRRRIRKMMTRMTMIHHWQQDGKRIRKTGGAITKRAAAAWKAVSVFGI